MTSHVPEFTEAVRQTGKRQGDPDQVWRVAPAPFCSSEGHRIVWVHSTVKHDRDEIARSQRIERTRAALDELNERMVGPRARVATRLAAEDAAAEILDTSGAERWITVTVTETIEERFRQEKRGRPGNDTRYRTRRPPQAPNTRPPRRSSTRPLAASTGGRRTRRTDATPHRPVNAAKPAANGSLPHEFDPSGSSRGTS